MAEAAGLNCKSNGASRAEWRHRRSIWPAESRPKRGRCMAEMQRPNWTDAETPSPGRMEPVLGNRRKRLESAKSSNPTKRVACRRGFQADASGSIPPHSSTRLCARRSRTAFLTIPIDMASADFSCGKQSCPDGNVLESEKRLDRFAPFRFKRAVYAYCDSSDAKRSSMADRFAIQKCRGGRVVDVTAKVGVENHGFVRSPNQRFVFHVRSGVG